jgi:hypothetical protein
MIVVETFSKPHAVASPAAIHLQTTKKGAKLLIISALNAA